MHKLKMKATRGLTFEEGCNKYLEYCRQRNLRQGTINHYRQSYVQFFKFFEPDTPIRSQRPLAKTCSFSISISWYLRDELPALTTKTFIFYPPIKLCIEECGYLC